MFHSSTTTLLAHWRGLRGERPAPLRRDLDPADFRQLLSQVFILGRTAPGDFRFRLAGGLVSDLHGRPLRGQSGLSAWAEHDQPHLLAVMEGVHRTAEPVVVTAVAQAGPAKVTLEILLAPVANAAGEIDRLIGLYQPLTPLAQLRDEPIDRLGVTRIVKALDALEETAPRLRLAAVGGRLVG